MGKAEHQKMNQFVLIFLLIGMAAVAQKKVEVKPYSIATTYEKLKKDYPSISPIQPLESAKISVIEEVVYKSMGERDLRLDIFTPKMENVKEHPAVLLIHGGGWISGSKENLHIMAQHLADNGYVAVTPAYRLSTEAPYPAAVLDLKEAIRWMRKNHETYNIDPNKIAVLGGSAGAQLATLLGVTAGSTLYSDKDSEVSDEVQAIVNIDGIVSFIHPEAEETEIAGLWLGGLQNENPNNWREASPLEYVDADTPPILFINSAQDRFHAGRDDMIKILDSNGIYTEVHSLPNTPHSFWLLNPWFQSTLDYTLDFLDKTLRQSSGQTPYRVIRVSKDGNADYSTIQEAVNSTRDLGPGEVLIQIEKGVYKEKLVIPSWKHKLTLVGEDPKTTILTNDDHSGKLDPLTQSKLSTFTSYTLLIQGDDIKIKNLSIENSSCGEGQAVALHVEGDRFVITNSRILGCQDTIYAATENSRQLYMNCYIEGTTDFIFGQATAVFRNCTIKSLQNSYITAAATTPQQDFGFVFQDCKLIAEENVDKVFLGRPWRPYAQTVFLNTEMGSHIVPEGWNAWKGDEMFPEKEKTAYYAEFNSSGEGGDTENRVSWSHQLTPEEAGKYTIENILSGADHWRPLQ